MLSTYLVRLYSGPQATTSLLTALLLRSTFLHLCLKSTPHSFLESLPRTHFISASLLKLLRSSCVARVIISRRFDCSHLETSNKVLCDPSASTQQCLPHAQEAESRPGGGGDMLPFPYRDNQGLFYPVVLPPWTQRNRNMNMMHQQQMMFMQHPQNMYAPPPQILPTPGLHNDTQVHFKGNRSRGPMGRRGGSQFSPRLNQTQPQQLYPRDSDRHKNKLKRKSSDSDLADRDALPKVGRYEGQGSVQLNSSRMGFNTSGSTSMHMTLINGAKPILHIPGQPCERITEAIVQYYNDFHQSEDDLKHKIVLSNCLYAIVRDIFPGCRLFIVGSSLSGFGTHTSDMDLCLLVTQIQDIDQRHEAVHILNAIHKSLRSCTFIRSSQVIKAKVPILKFTDTMKNIECDLNINNGVGIRNTHLLKYYCLSDTRVAPLMLFIKFWARFHDINDAHKRTISSYSLALMLIHYLQVCTPPVLPCLQKLYPDRFHSRVDLQNLRLDEPLQDLGCENTDSLGKLFQGFLDYYAFTFRPGFDVISVREGCVLSRQMVQCNSRDPMQWKCLCIEEPFDKSNTARSVFDPHIFQRIQHVFYRSAQVLRKEGTVSAILSVPF